MHLLKILIVVALVMVGNVSIQAGVVLSNLGQTGLVNRNDETSAGQTATNRTAAGFRIGGPYQFDIASVGLIMASSDLSVPVSASMAIYTDNGGHPSSTRLVESASLIVGLQQVYQFVFTGDYRLNANTTYWAVVQTGIGSRWFTSVDGNPVPLNRSSLTFVDYRRTTTFDTVVTWAGSPASFLGFSVFGVDYVPEPALTSLLCFGGIALIRRRVKK